MGAFGNCQVHFTILFSLTLLSACHSGSENLSADISLHNPQGIINGTEVKNEEPLAKNTVLLVNRTEDNQYTCTATLLGGPYALTAAHCLDYENPQNLYVFFDSRPTSQTERRQIVAQEASQYWGLWKYRKNAGDIAIIKFEGDTLPEGYQGVEFLKDDSVLQKNREVLVLGYGLAGVAPEKEVLALRKSSLPIVNPSYSATELLLDQMKGPRVTYGDSGGPAYVWFKGRYYFWGLANREVALEDTPNPKVGVVYTNVLMYKAWIQYVLKSL